MNNKSSVLGNASWIILGKIAQSLLGLVVTMLSARYLGPSNYGVINYAASIVAFMTPITLLGLDSILVQEIVLKEEQEEDVLGTAIGGALIASVLSIIGVVAFSLIVSPTEKETIIVCFLYSLILIFQALGLMQYWFQAQLLSKYSAITMLIAYLITTLYKIVLLITKSNVYWFALSNVLDAIIIAVVLLVIYRKKTKKKLHFSVELLKTLISKSKYYILANIMITVCAQTDKIMLKIFLDETATGLYTAAVTCATMSGFVFSAIIDSARPVILTSKNNDKDKYVLTVKQLFSVIIYLSLAQSIFLTLFSKLIIKILFGVDYLAAASVLGVVVWYTTFAYIGSVRGIWLLAENKQKYVATTSILAAGGNVVFNIIFIPIMGVKGAALASLLSQIWANILVPTLIKEIRSSNILLLKSLHPKYMLQLAHILFNKITP